MKRKNFIRDVLMAMAIVMVPEILRPAIPQIPEMVEVQFQVNWFVIGADPATLFVV